MPAHEPQDHLGTVCDDGVGEVPPIVRCKSDNRHHSAGFDQFGESSECLLGRNVMERGDRQHSVERTHLERDVKQIALPPFDRDPNMACPCPLEDLPVQVESNDLLNTGATQMH